MRTLKTLLASLLCSALCFSSTCFAAQGEGPNSGPDYDIDSKTGDRYAIDPSRSIFSLDLIKNPDRPRSYFLSPLLTFILPGFDQLRESQLPQAGFYAGSAIAGLVLALQTSSKNRATRVDDRNEQARWSALGGQIYMAAGSFSAYSAFRSAVRTQQPLGKFGFLTHEEKVDDLLKAPFDVSMIKRPTTFIPLILTLGLAVAIVTDHAEPFMHNDYNVNDPVFASSFSYLAGTNEEALFRGWLMPVSMNLLNSEFWSNTTTATLFAAAHLGSTRLPWPQFVLGWYFGYLTQRNEWTLAESIFIHAWYDVLVFTASYLYDSKNDPAHAVIRTPVLQLSF